MPMERGDLALAFGHRTPEESTLAYLESDTFKVHEAQDQLLTVRQEPVTQEVATFTSSGSSPAVAQPRPMDPDTAPPTYITPDGAPKAPVSAVQSLMDQITAPPAGSGGQAALGATGVIGNDVDPSLFVSTFGGVPSADPKTTAGIQSRQAGGISGQQLALVAAAVLVVGVISGLVVR